MPALSFSTFYDKLISGEKQQTIRRPRKRPLKVGDKLYIYWKQRTPNREFLGIAEVTNIRRVLLGEVTEREAVLDGFSSVKDLIQGFQSVYGESVEIMAFDIINFKWLEQKPTVEKVIQLFKEKKPTLRVRRFEGN